jgi:hypothetical protein
LLGPDHENDATSDWADGDEAILEVGMLFVEDLEIVRARKQQYASLLERKAVLLLVREVLGFIR